MADLTAAPRFWAGAGLALLAAALLASASIAAVIAYDAGAEPLSVAGVGFAGTILLLYALLRLTGGAIRLDRRARAAALALGAAQAAQSYCLYSSFDHIPVGLATIFFYVYPFLVGLLASAVGQDRLTRTLLAGLALAFAGLLLILNVAGEELDRTGALFALLAALSWTVVVVVSGSLIRGGDSRPVTFHVQASAQLLFLVALLAAGDVRFPAGMAGWTAYALAPALYGVAMTCFFAATVRIGSIRTSLMMNFEIVAAVGLGYLALGQTLTPLQLLGGAIVILALLAVGRGRAAAKGSG